MAQSYFSFPLPGEEASVVSEEPQAIEESLAHAEDVQQAYIEQKDRLVAAIDTTKSILNDLRQFNKDSWVVRYPYLARPSSDAPSTAVRHLRRSLSFADDPANHTDVVVNPKHKGIQRSFTLATIPDNAEAASDSETLRGDDSSSETSSDAETLVDPQAASDFHVLRLDLKLGASGSNTAGALVSQLEKSSIANLLDERISSSVQHVDKLRARVEDTSSKVLVTGDLNAGKSTFVNALLRRNVMPVDQQPCTTMFCEVHDKAENEGVEEAHVYKVGAVYDRTNEATFTRVSLSDLEHVVTDSDTQHVLKLYVSDARAPGESLLSNGVVDIALIDAPGLNRDSLKTTAVFARQEEIDVVVFVVSAENHFTLSAKEFLWNASNEKAYIFIVVNRFDQIRDKARCKRLVLEQIKQFSPQTWEDAEDLVHFVDSSSALAKGILKNSTNPAVAAATTEEDAFDQLESALRSFVLVKRAKSKLMPASTYLSHVLSDVDLLASANAIVAQREVAQAQADLARARPILHKMQKGREGLEDGLESEEDGSTERAAARAKATLEGALERVGRGEVGVVGSPSAPELPAYPGLLRIWDYVRDVRQTLLASLDLAVKMAEDEARVITSAGVSRVSELGEKYLPEGVERSRRVFLPQAMFVPRKSQSPSTPTKDSGKPAHHRRQTSTLSTRGLGFVGLQPLVLRPELNKVTFMDIFDFQHHVIDRLTDSSSKEAEDDESSASALSTLGLGIGALSMVGGKTIGARGILEGLVRLGDLFGNERSRKWMAPVIGIVSLGAAVYFVLELPSTIPRTVGRHIRSSLVASKAVGEQGPFVEVHAVRISRETRKVLRLASWDLRERFRNAMEERGREVRAAEEVEKKALRAIEWFGEVEKRTEAVRVEAKLVESV